MRLLHRLMLFIAVGALGLAGSALGSPVTAYFGGTTTQYYDYVTGVNDPAGTIGLPFSGWVTFDLANAQSTVSYDSGGTADAYTWRETIRGCFEIVNSVCTYDYGADIPVVTDYSVSVPFAPLGGYQPFPENAYLYDNSFRENYRAYPPANPPNGFDEYFIYRDQYQNQYMGDLSGAYRYESNARLFRLFPSVDENALFSSVSDLLAAPNLNVVPSNQWNVMSVLVTFNLNCDANIGCETLNGYAAGSNRWQGTLTSLQIVAGEANGIPEPATLALLGIGLAGLGFSRRKQ